jgi:hypothetical protein
LGDFKDVAGHGGGKKDRLSGGREELEDIVNLILEPALQLALSCRVIYGKHLIGLIEDKHLDLVGRKGTTILNHIQYTTGRSNYDLHSVLQDLDIITHGGSANTRMTLHQ